ncbi:MAG: toxin YoeB [Chthoniobacter sp.]|jgi:toxin YoeB|nr:toxin YoeB [Chthoniobacter sp.]
MRRVVFHAEAFEQFSAWARQDSRLFERITRLIMDAARDPFHGVGKPEPLRHQLKGFWSRRINDEHRLVYRVTEAEIIVASCRYHY